MATSGTTTFNETRDTLISNALQLLGYLAAGETANANDITFCASIMNQMMKAWQAQGIHLWTTEEGTLFLVNGQAQYSLTSSGGANASDGTGTPVETTTTAAAATGATSIVCTTVTGMTAADNIGVVLDDGTITWTTIVSVTASTKTIVLTAGIASAASSGNNVYTYTTNLGRVLSIQSARCRDVNTFDRTMRIIPRNDYMRIVNKTLTGLPVILMYTPQITNGIVYVWPAPSSGTSRIEFTYLRSIQDFDNSGDNADLPQEWLECIVYNLAVRIAPAYGINLASGGFSGNPGLVTQAAMYLEELKAWDVEQPFVQFVPGYRSHH